MEIKEQIHSFATSLIDKTVAKTIHMLLSRPDFETVLGGMYLLVKNGVKPFDAWKISNRCLREFLSDERIEYGNSRYHWGIDAGIEIVTEYEIRHWDKARGK